MVIDQAQKINQQVYVIERPYLITASRSARETKRKQFIYNRIPILEVTDKGVSDNKNEKNNTDP